MKQRYRFRVYEPDGAPRGELISPGDYGFSSTYNDIPGMTLKYQDSMPGAEFLLTPCEVAVEYSVDGITWAEPRNGRYLRLGRNSEVVGQDDVRGYTLPGYGHLLEKGRQMVTTGLTSDNKRSFNSSTAGRIMATLLQENQNTWGALTGMDWDFSTTHDSFGVAWNKIISIGYAPGLELLTILRNLGDQDVCDWWFEGRTLRMSNVGSTVRNVTFRAGVDLKKMPVTGNLDDLVHTALVTGEGGVKMVLQGQFDAPVYWGNWLGHIENGGVSDPATMTILGNTMLENGSKEKLQYNLEIDTEATGWEPFVDYVPGDFVHGINVDRAAEDYRVRAINLARNAQGELALTLIANDRFVEKEVARARRVNGISGGAVTGGSGVRPSPETPVGKKPSKVLGVGWLSEAYISFVGLPLGFVIVSWVPVNTDVDGFALEIARYEVRAVSAAGNTFSWGSFEQSPGSKDELECGSTWSISVRAVSNQGVAGAWSDPIVALVASDVTPPAKPSTPILTTLLGTVTVTWNGLTFNGNPMPPDLLRIDVLQADEGGVLEVIGSINPNPEGGFLVSTDVIVGDEYTYAFRGVDTSDNEGELSNQPTIVVAGVLDNPIILDEITSIASAVGGGNRNVYATTAAPNPETVARQENDNWYQLDGVTGDVIGQWRWDGTVWVPVELTDLVIASLDAGKIVTGTLAAARIGANAIDANKIAAGAVTAVKLSATAIDGKTITGVVITGGTIYTGTRTSPTLGKGTYIAPSGLINAQNASGQQFFSVEPDNDRVVIIGKIQSGRTLPRIEIDDDAWPTYAGIRFYTNSSTVNIAQIKVRDSTGPTGKPVGTLYLMSGKPTTTGAEQQNRTTFFMAYNEIEASVTDGNNYERSRLELTGNILLAVRNGGGQPNSGMLTHRIRSDGNGLWMETYDEAVAAAADQSTLVLATARNGHSYWEAYGTIRITANRLNLTTQDLLLQSGNGSLNIGYDVDGQRVWSPSIYSRTYTNAPSMYITSFGTMGRSTSSSRNKLNITPKDFGEAVLDLEPVTWFDKTSSELWAGKLTAETEGDEKRKEMFRKTDIEPLIPIPGLIAETVAEAPGLEDFVIRGPDGQIEGYSERLWVTLIPIVRKLRDRVTALEKKAGTVK